MLNGQTPSLTMEQIKEAAVQFKEDLQREANRAVRRHDQNQALAALEAIEYVEKFVYTLEMRAGSQIGRPARARNIRIFQKKG